ncbi:hypothetical protein PUNSTDRAFT_47385 [Punctularia strigosozonata HHB-11173 SS5]|uniref:C2H2-type domain-containing protein n=1 Tax=Punctularia strigosozonata (strain HHB-11173) TaxID=741275 RepID=R7S4P1_PUNST|nr:uncharacterized protein PUNSTDRAFT_47385 [Punctularia strigosozonata HHB-11173 SS5]EIN04757.1 hypothetical protein PUNSTDRAFT_47385 [Punctularia strigosozonata HHB-11173 SS5]
MVASKAVATEKRGRATEPPPASISSTSTVIGSTGADVGSQLLDIGSSSSLYPQARLGGSQTHEELGDSGLHGFYAQQPTASLDPDFGSRMPALPAANGGVADIHADGLRDPFIDLSNTSNHPWLVSNAEDQAMKPLAGSAVGGWLHERRAVSYLPSYSTDRIEMAPSSSGLVHADESRASELSVLSTPSYPQNSDHIHMPSDLHEHPLDHSALPGPQVGHSIGDRTVLTDPSTGNQFNTIQWLQNLLEHCHRQQTSDPSTSSPPTESAALIAAITIRGLRMWPPAAPVDEAYIQRLQDIVDAYERSLDVQPAPQPLAGPLADVPVAIRDEDPFSFLADEDWQGQDTARTPQGASSPNTAGMIPGGTRPIEGNDADPYTDLFSWLNAQPWYSADTAASEETLGSLLEEIGRDSKEDLFSTAAAQIGAEPSLQASLNPFAASFPDLDLSSMSSPANFYLPNGWEAEHGRDIFPDVPDLQPSVSDFDRFSIDLSYGTSQGLDAPSSGSSSSAPQGAVFNFDAFEVIAPIGVGHGLDTSLSEQPYAALDLGGDMEVDSPIGADYDAHASLFGSSPPEPQPGVFHIDGFEVISAPNVTDRASRGSSLAFPSKQQTRHRLPDRREDSASTPSSALSGPARSASSSRTVPSEQHQSSQSSSGREASSSTASTPSVPGWPSSATDILLDMQNCVRPSKDISAECIYAGCTVVVTGWTESRNHIREHVLEKYGAKGDKKFAANKMPKELECDFCDYVASNTSHMISHIIGLQHMCIVPQCKTCGRYFHNEDAVYTHHQKKHQKTDKKARK